MRLHSIKSLSIKMRMQSPSELVSLGLLRNVSTLFGFLTIVRYGMGVLITHVCCLSRSVLGSGWVDDCRMSASAANRSRHIYNISQNPEDVKARRAWF